MNQRALRNHRSASCRLICLSTLLTLCCLSGAVHAQSLEKQKAAEGEYAKMKSGASLSENQSWVLWRLPDGSYSLEDHFEIVNPTAVLLAAMPSKTLSPELREQLNAEVVQTELEVALSSDFRIQSFVLKGRRLMSGKPIEIAACESHETQTQCSGISGHTKLGTKNSADLFYAFPFPMLFASLARQTGATSAVRIPLKVALADVDVEKHLVRLTEAEAQVEDLGEEALQIGDRNFRSDKFHVQVTAAGKQALEVYVWCSATGVVFALADERNFPGERIALVRFKRYSEF